MKHCLATLLLSASIFASAIFSGCSRSLNDDEAAQKTEGVPKTEKQKAGFREMVKKPELWKETQRKLNEREAARQSLSVPDDISDAEIREMVERLFVHEDKDFNYDRLKLVGERAKPFLLEALNDPRVARRFSSGDLSFGPDFPLERICGLLMELDPPAAAKALAAYAEHESDEHRKHAAIVLGEIGTSACIEPILKLLDDEDDYVRSYAMMGIERGIKKGSSTQEFLKAVFPALVKLLDRRDKSVGGEAPVLLLEIDQDKAPPILLSEKYFTITNRELHYIIEALNESGEIIPHDKLLPLLKDLKPRIAEYPFDYQYAEALKAYAHNPDSKAEQTFRLELTSTNELVQEAAAESLGILKGVTNPFDIVFEIWKQEGFKGLSKPQKLYWAAIGYDGEVNNGGHSQYFFNSSGDGWKAAIAGLKAIGAKERASILQEALDLFGPTGPPEDRESRHIQLADFTTEQDKVLDKLDTQYYECKENMDALLALYAIKHKEHFVSRK